MLLTHSCLDVILLSVAACQRCWVSNCVSITHTHSFFTLSACGATPTLPPSSYQAGVSLGGRVGSLRDLPGLQVSVFLSGYYLPSQGFVKV